MKGEGEIGQGLLGCVDDEGRPILERVDLMEAFFTVRSKNHVCRMVRFSEARRLRMYLSFFLFF